MNKDQATRRDATGMGAGVRGLERPEPSRWRLLYQSLTFHNTAIASMAASANHARLGCPFGMMIQAASSGPSALPALPPTWNIDCAKPWRPPEARRAMREDSG